MQQQLTQIFTRPARLGDLLKEAESRHLIIPVWETKEGKQIKVSDMTDQHLINAIQHIKKCAEREEIVAAYLDAEE